MVEQWNGNQQEINLQEEIEKQRLLFLIQQQALKIRDDTYKEFQQGTDGGLLYMLLQQFDEMIFPVEYVRLITGIEQEDYPQILHSAHNLRGCIAYLGICHDYDLVYSIEYTIKPKMAYDSEWKCYFKDPLSEEEKLRICDQAQQLLENYERLQIIIEKVYARGVSNPHLVGELLQRLDRVIKSRFAHIRNGEGVVEKPLVQAQEPLLQGDETRPLEQFCKPECAIF